MPDWIHGASCGDPDGRRPRRFPARRGTAAVRRPGRAMSRRLRAALIAGAVAALAFQVVVRYVPGPPPPLIWTVVTVPVGLSFLVAGIAAWQRWPASRLGLLFTIVGYAWILPNVGF